MSGGDTAWKIVTTTSGTRARQRTEKPATHKSHDARCVVVLIIGATAMSRLSAASQLATWRTAPMKPMAELLRESGPETN